VTTANDRTSEYPIDPMFLERWSPRAFTGEEMPEADLLSMIDAGHWAASSYNAQPWRFVYARRNTSPWDRLLNLLNPSNRAWAERASALLIIVSYGLMARPGGEKPIPSHSHSFDTGMAVAQFILQGMKLGYHSHGMVGFDINRAYAELNVPADHRVEAAFAVGRKADKSILPEATRAREKPNQRNPVKGIAFEGGFRATANSAV
jgi:nitroreductase